ncbi:histidine kinase [Spirochaetia bacterium]|nr:histidine kinase [Spirochaetia bacterium]
MTFSKELRLPARLEELESLQALVEEFLEHEGYGPKICNQVSVVTEELFVNITRYAYDGKNGEALVRIGVELPFLTLQFEDTGKPFNPLDQPPPDTNASLEDRPSGGLGIYLTMKMMDEVHYERIDGKNCLTIRKKIEGK